MYIPFAADTVDSFLPLRSWMSSDVVWRVVVTFSMPVMSAVFHVMQS